MAPYLMSIFVLALFSLLSHFVHALFSFEGGARARHPMGVVYTYPATHGVFEMGLFGLYTGETYFPGSNNL